MYTIRNLITGESVTSCTDMRRASRIAAPFEHHVAEDDHSLRYWFWGWERHRMNERHPIDVRAEERLHARVEQLVADYRAGVLKRRGDEWATRG